MRSVMSGRRCWALLLGVATLTTVSTLLLLLVRVNGRYVDDGYLASARRLLLGVGARRVQATPLQRLWMANATGPEGVAGGCVIPFYGCYEYEFKWLAEVVWRELEPRGCTVLVRDLADLVPDFEAQTAADGTFTPAYPHTILLMVEEYGGGGGGGGGSSGNDPGRKQWHEARYADYFRLNATAVQLGDEVEAKSLDYLPYFTRVFRNYNGHGERAGSLVQLTDERGVDRMSMAQLAAIPHEPGQVSWWFPLGYSSALLAAPVLHVPLLQRPLLYFWSAGVAGKPERGEFLASLDGRPDIKALGEMHVYGDFQLMGSADHLRPALYTRLMHSAAIIPCPAGQSPEQFRISEALQAGAIPMVRRGHFHLRYLDRLDLRYLAVDSFARGADELARVTTDTALQAELVAWQEHNARRWPQLLRRVGRHFAATVLAAIPGQLLDV